MEERFQELAMLKLAGRASTEESSELDKLLSENPDFRTEFEQLQREIHAIKDLTPIVQAPETSDEEVPAYEKTAFLTEVGEIFDKPAEANENSISEEEHSHSSAEESQPLFPFLKVAIGLAAAVAVILIAIPKDNKPSPIAKTPEPVIQLAMLDIVGETRGEEDDKVKSLKEVWPQTQLETYSEIDLAKAWREQWGDDSKTPQFKIFYDVTEAEIKIIGRWGETNNTEVVLVDGNLREALSKARQIANLNFFHEINPERIPNIPQQAPSPLLPKEGIQVAPNDPIKSELDKATELMAANIANALMAFKDVNKPDAEKVQAFDQIIEQIQVANKLVAEDGDLYKEVKETLERQLESQKKWEAKARDPAIPEDRRKIYAKLAEDEAANSKKIANMLVILIDINEELDQRVFDTNKAKKFYVDMVDDGQLEKAEEEVLDRVAILMEDVIKDLDKLGSPEMEDLFKNPPVDKK